MPVSGQQAKHWANRYICICKIGNGAFGTVYKVQDNSIPEGHGSIKVLKEIQVTNMDQDEVDECAREGKLLSKLSHPGIVQFFDSFCYGEFYCIITEFCEGGDLNQLIVNTKKQGARLEEKRILRWFIQLLQALNYIHKRKILHRDLKTRNVFLKNDSIKIGDFGISRILNCTMDMASTFVGTPFYMSPEVLKHDGYNAVSDVWSAGVILYEMCALQHAYDAHGIMAVMYKIVEGPCPTIPDYYSKDLQNIVEKVMVKDPVVRPTASDILKMEYILKTCHDTYLDLNSTTDLDDSIIKSDTKAIQSFVTEPNNIKTLKDCSPNDTLTPKEKMLLRKKEKADLEAEKNKKMASQIYHENREVTMIRKQKSSIDSLPFSNRRFQNNVSLTSSYDERYQRMKGINGDLTRASGSKTIIPQRNQRLEPIENKTHGSDSYPCYGVWEPSNRERQSNSATVIPVTELDKTFTIPSKNQYQMYIMNDKDMQYIDPSACHVTTFDPAMNSECKVADNIFYEDDFSSVSDGYQSDDDAQDKNLDVPSDNVLTKFQDDEDKDPYGSKTKKTKIANMKKKCLEKLSSVMLEKALRFLDDNRDRDNYNVKLRQICMSDDAALLVDQLHFLKNSNSEIY